MNVERLQELKRFLESLLDARLIETGTFDLGTWFSGGSQDNLSMDVLCETVMGDTPVQVTRIDTAKSIEKSCGFAACAIGWATSNPVFNEQGFYMEGQVDKRRDALISITPKFRSEESWEAVYAFFGLDSCEANWLFDDRSYLDYCDETVIDIGPKRVANRIGLLLDGWTDFENCAV